MTTSNSWRSSMPGAPAGGPVLNDYEHGGQVFDDYDPDYFSLERCRERNEAAQRSMEEFTDRLQSSQFIGTAADGMITATVQGAGGISAIQIDPYVVKRYGVEGLGDLVMRAISDGMRQSAGLMNELMGESAPDASSTENDN